MFTISRTRLLAGAATLALTASLTAVPSFAGTETATMGVSAQINQGCTVTSDGDLLFGSVEPGVKDTADTTFTVNCDFGGDVTVEVGVGLNHDGTFRQMEDAGKLLQYQLFQSTAESTQ